MGKTLGETRVWTEFNPDKNSAVDLIKQKSAELINLVNELGAPQGLDPHSNQMGEFMRLKSLAMTEYENAAMWAVKAATA